MESMTEKREKDVFKRLLFIILGILIILCIFLVRMLLKDTTQKGEILLTLSEGAISGAITLGSLYFVIHFQEKSHQEQLKQQRKLFIDQINENKLPYFILQQKGNSSATIELCARPLRDEISSILSEKKDISPEEFRLIKCTVFNTTAAWAINIRIKGNKTLYHCKPNDSFEVELYMCEESPPKTIILNYNDCRGVEYEQKFMIKGNDLAHTLRFISQIPIKKKETTINED